MKLTILGSGSRGNACLIQTERTRILLDAGLTCRTLTERLAQLRVGPESLDALVLTHEHGDHLRGAGPLARRYGVPVWASQGTFDAGASALGDLPVTRLLESADSFAIGDIGMEAFSISHDAADPLGFRLSAGRESACYVTDTGLYTSLIRQYARDCDYLVMESNHDEFMLMEGRYPWSVKQRVRSRRGHASNREAACFLQDVWSPRLQAVVLAHLSDENNELARAYGESLRVLRALEADTALYVSRQDLVGTTLCAAPVDHAPLGAIS